jgi:hypothetical protein
MVERIFAILTVAAILMMMTVTAATPILHIRSADAQEEVEKSGDLTVPEEDMPFGGDNVGTYSIGQDRYGLRVQVNMDISPTSDNVYEAWLVDNATGSDLSVGQLVDNELATTQEITNSSLYNLIEVTEERANDPNPARNSSAIVAGAELEG